MGACLECAGKGVMLVQPLPWRPSQVATFGDDNIWLAMQHLYLLAQKEKSWLNRKRGRRLLKERYAVDSMDRSSAGIRKRRDEARRQRLEAAEKKLAAKAAKRAAIDARKLAAGLGVTDDASGLAHGGADGDSKVDAPKQRDRGDSKGNPSDAGDDVDAASVVAFSIAAGTGVDGGAAAGSRAIGGRSSVKDALQAVRRMSGVVGGIIPGGAGARAVGKDHIGSNAVVTADDEVAEFDGNIDLPATDFVIVEDVNHEVEACFLYLKTKRRRAAAKFDYVADDEMERRMHALLFVHMSTIAVSGITFWSPIDYDEINAKLVIPLIESRIKQMLALFVKIDDERLGYVTDQQMAYWVGNESVATSITFPFAFTCVKVGRPGKLTFPEFVHVVNEFCTMDEAEVYDMAFAQLVLRSGNAVMKSKTVKAGFGTVTSKDSLSINVSALIRKYPALTAATATGRSNAFDQSLVQALIEKGVQQDQEDPDLVVTESAFISAMQRRIALQRKQFAEEHDLDSDDEFAMGWHDIVDEKYLSPKAAERRDDDLLVGRHHFHRVVSTSSQALFAMLFLRTFLIGETFGMPWWNKQAKAIRAIRQSRDRKDKAKSDKNKTEDQLLREMGAIEADAVSSPTRGGADRAADRISEINDHRRILAQPSGYLNFLPVTDAEKVNKKLEKERHKTATDEIAAGVSRALRDMPSSAGAGHKGRMTKEQRAKAKRHAAMVRSQIAAMSGARGGDFDEYFGDEAADGDDAAGGDDPALDGVASAAFASPAGKAGARGKRKPKRRSRASLANEKAAMDVGWAATGLSAKQRRLKAARARRRSTAT